MNTNSNVWRRIPARHTDEKTYGRTQRAFRRGDGALLLLHRPQSRNAKMYDRIAVWVVVVDQTVVRRRAVYGRVVQATPIRWANRALRQFLRGDCGSACHLLNGRRPTVAESIREMPVRPDELPATIIGKHLCGRPDPKTVIDVPAVLSLVPPERMIAGIYIERVVSVDEFCVYAEAWERFTHRYPECDTAGHKENLQRICTADVQMCRLLLLGRHAKISPKRAASLYHTAWRKWHTARQSLLSVLAPPDSTRSSRRSTVKRGGNATPCDEWHPLFRGWEGTPSGR